ncbi:unnamed protein product [Pocillopora meandrina]|uniref:Uncharacterized protein n=1 Tax=Pocillopora meandrina TaxID=46732 RepID=A0AAU9VQ83_9CNID|nr:unnamed protein product [Pocillopora meandrina]
MKVAVVQVECLPYFNQAQLRGEQFSLEDCIRGGIVSVVNVD